MIGIDEVGRGAWAGPLLVVAARARNVLPDGLTDSKVLSKSRREAYVRLIAELCDLGCGWVDNTEVDTLGLAEGMKLGVKRALSDINAENHEEIIMDGHINYCEPQFVNVSCKVKADKTDQIVSAASIYAKVLRDTYMTDLSARFPNYGFESHVGYGTMRHVDALKKYGVSAIHRLSYKPVKVFS